MKNFVLLFTELHSKWFDFIFSRQNRKLRDSSNESDDDLDAGTSSPPPRSTIDDTKNVLPSRIKAVAVRTIEISTKMKTINRKNNVNFFVLFLLKQHADNHRNVQIRNIISSIITSETFYVECLTKMLHVRYFEFCFCFSIFPK